MCVRPASRVFGFVRCLISVRGRDILSWQASQEGDEVGEIIARKLPLISKY